MQQESGQREASEGLTPAVRPDLTSGKFPSIERALNNQQTRALYPNISWHRSFDLKPVHNLSNREIYRRTELHPEYGTLKQQTKFLGELIKILQEIVPDQLSSYEVDPDKQPWEVMVDLMNFEIFGEDDKLFRVYEGVNGKEMQFIRYVEYDMICPDGNSISIKWLKHIYRWDETYAELVYDMFAMLRRENNVPGIWNNYLEDHSVEYLEEMVECNNSYGYEEDEIEIWSEWIREYRFIVGGIANNIENRNVSIDDFRSRVQKLRPKLQTKKHLKKWFLMAADLAETNQNFADYIGGYDVNADEYGQAPRQPEEWCSFYWSFSDSDPVASFHQQEFSEYAGEFGVDTFILCKIYNSKNPQGFGSSIEIKEHDFPLRMMDFMDYYCKYLWDDMIAIYYKHERRLQNVLTRTSPHYLSEE